jgi:hypothetical protein
MISLTISLTPETSENTFSNWLGIVKRRENGSIIHLPKRDQLYRIHAFLQSKEILKKYLKTPENYQFILLDLMALPIEDSNDLEKFVKTQIKPKYKQTVLFVLDADKLIDEKISLISTLNNFYYQIPTLSVLYFFGKNITFPSLSKKLSSYTSLYQNINIFPYLKKEDSCHFVKYLGKKLKVNIPEKLITKIVDTCGGISWLIKEACRDWSKTNDENHIFNHDEMRIKVNILIEEMMVEEKQVLEKIIKHNYSFNFEEKAILKYLLQTNTLIKKNDQYSFNSPLIEDVFKQQLSEKLKIESNNNHDLIINGVAINNYFSKRERKLLIYLMSKKGEVVKREIAGKIIWKDCSNSYADWALDQFILRLRKKLLSLGFEKNFIRTIKNQGYILS